MGSSSSRSLFTLYRNSQLEAGLTTVCAESLICPLCWEEVHVDNLSVEHVIPTSVGGVSTVLTCERCNNSHGSQLDSQIAPYQRMTDAFAGHRKFPGEIFVDGRRLAVQVDWGQAFKNFEVVGRATNPADQEMIKAAFTSGAVREVKFEFSYGYRLNEFRVAILRCAYLVLYKWLGYPYVASEMAQILRRRIANPSLVTPRLETMQLELRSTNLPQTISHFVFPGAVTLGPDETNQTPFYLVILRISQKTTTWLGVFMPQAPATPDTFFELIEKMRHEYDGKVLSLPTQGLLFDAREI